MSLADMPYGSRPADPKRAGWVLDADKTWNTKADGTGLQLKITTTLDELLKAVCGDDYNADDFLKAGGILTLYADLEPERSVRGHLRHEQYEREESEHPERHA